MHLCKTCRQTVKKSGAHAPKPNPIRVLVVDDHEVIRSGLSAFLCADPGLVMVGEAGSGEEAIDLCQKLGPDVVLMDLVMPGMDGVEAIRIIRARYPHIQIMAFTSFAEMELVQQALAAGAIAYVLKDIPLADLARAIRDAYSGRATLSSEAAQYLIEATRQATGTRPDLTQRERQVLALMVQGLSNSEIAEKLVISRPTVKYHVSHILAKMGVTRRAQAMSLAVRLHLVDSDQ